MARVFVSPSTQERNIYAGGFGTEEQWMRVIAWKVTEHLAAAGHQVKLGGTVSATDNANQANTWGAEWYVAIHSNAGGGHGTEVWHYTGSTRGATLAAAIYRHVAPVSDFPDRGIKNNTTFAELRIPKAPSALVEVAFHDNPVEAAQIVAEVDEYALAIARAVCEVVGGTVPTPAPPTPPPVEPPAPPTNPSPTWAWVVKEQSIDRIVLVRTLV